ncbi:MAG TPA: DUF1993 domain-containing protein [Burkholderiaceae bacterium]|jgi:hypothetical protein|nr:DUF1993 domain-containing protein [Burkholderiaceae bacterium]
MSISMHSASVPVFERMLGNLVKWLDKAEAHAQARKFDSKVFLATRLAPDMLPLSAQVQIACDAAKFGVARLSGVEAPKFEDNETTLAELRERVAGTIAFLKSVPSSAVDGSEDKPISVPRRNAEPLQFRGEDYLRFMALPNFFFHVTTTYALLRHGGVELGKPDYLGGR